MRGVVCPNCQTRNRSGSKFCNECGASLPVPDPAAASQPAEARPIPAEVSKLVNEQPWLGEAGDDEAGAQPAGATDLANVLGGLQGTLSAEPWTRRLRLDEAVATASQAPAVNADHLAMLAGAPPPAAPPARDLSALSQASPPRWLWFLLLGVVFLALILQPALDSPVPVPPADTAVQRAFAAIDGLERGAIVLVAWDFDPSTNGEMALLADALVGHLLRRNVQLLTLSLLPAGPPLAQAQIARLIGQYPSFSGVRPPPIDLGYLPGGDIALRTFSQDPLQAVPESLATVELQRRLESGALKAAGPALRDLTGVSLLLVLTAEADDGRAWIEQVTSRTGVATVVGASAAAGPGLAPYAEAGQLAGLVQGYDGALGYEALYRTPEEAAALCRDARDRPAACESVLPQRWGQLVLLLGLLAGNLAALGNRLRRWLA